MPISEIEGKKKKNLEKELKKKGGEKTTNLILIYR